MENHTLRNEFPQYQQRIEKLRMRSEEFKSLYVNYEEVNAIIQHFERGGFSHTSDTHLNELRKRRLKLKDSIYKHLSFEPN